MRVRTVKINSKNQIIKLNGRIISTLICKFLCWIDCFSLSCVSKSLSFKRPLLSEIVKKDFKRKGLDYDLLFKDGVVLHGSILHDYIYGTNLAKNINLYTLNSIQQVVAKKYVPSQANDHNQNLTLYVQLEKDEKDITLMSYYIHTEIDKFIDKYVDMSTSKMYFDGEKLHYKNIDHLLNRSFKINCSYRVTYPNLTLPSVDAWVRKLNIYTKYKGRGYKCLNEGDVNKYLKSRLQSLEDEQAINSCWCVIF